MDIGIKIIIAVVVILVLIGIKMVCDEKARRKRMTVECYCQLL